MATDAQIVAAAAFDRLFVNDDAIVSAGADCAFFDASGERAAPRVVERVRAALAEGSPLSLVRVGNGEGNAIAMVEDARSPAVFDGFDVEFVSQNGWSITPEQALPFSRLVVDAITSADIQGYRIGRFDERAVALDCLAKGATSPALGISYARWLFAGQLRGPASQTRWFTSAWIHLDLMPLFAAMVEQARHVVVISGRAELAATFAEKLGSRLAWFAPVPVQGYVPHYAMFGAVRDRIRQSDLRGTLVLVGAGLFGKVYCQDARDAGAVAIDMGSAFDLFAGVSTRPVHRFVDLSAVRW